MNKAEQNGMKKSMYICTCVSKAALCVFPAATELREGEPGRLGCVLMHDTGSCVNWGWGGGGYTFCGVLRT
eukprot:15355093-Ditylum_brightwellii.AAC.1